MNPFESSAQYFPTQLQQFQYFDKYSRYDYSKGRREAWGETGDRAIDYLAERCAAQNTSGAQEVIAWLQNPGRKMLLTMQALPSMRLIAMAGVPARRQNLCIYNCAYVAVDNAQAWVEMLIISMAGCGVGFSVERQYVEQLPIIRSQRGETKRHIIEDSSEGWAEALRFGLECWFNGLDVDYDFSQLRKAGSPLRTKGGRASGPEPLCEMLLGIRRIILSCQGTKLRSLNAHDISCLVGGAAVQGGMRRTAMLSLSDPEDREMATAKHGSFPDFRWNANNSSAWSEQGLDDAEIRRHFLEMDLGRRGERGIFSRQAVMETMTARRKALWPMGIKPGVNPCGEIILRPKGLCNLSIAVAREDDTLATLVLKVKAAAIFGTIQATATHFPGLRDEWRINAEEERLLGVDITGQRDCPLFNSAERDEVQQYLKNIAIETNIETARLLGITPSLAVTCVKPSGNSSTKLNCAPGLHARHSRYYIRNVRVSAHSPVYHVLRASGAPLSPENGQTAETATTWVCSFPVEAPQQACLKEHLSALNQLDIWLSSKLHYTEHNPSCTITYKPEELEGVISWVIKHKAVIGGLSFLPWENPQYEQMPYIEISENEYQTRAGAFPAIDWSLIAGFENEDLTQAAQEIACSAGQCLI